MDLLNKVYSVETKASVIGCCLICRERLIYWINKLIAPHSLHHFSWISILQSGIKLRQDW